MVILRESWFFKVGVMSFIYPLENWPELRLLQFNQWLIGDGEIHAYDEMHVPYFELDS